MAHGPTGCLGIKPAEPEIGQNVCVHKTSITLTGLFPPTQSSEQFELPPLVHYPHL